MVTLGTRIDGDRGRADDALAPGLVRSGAVVAPNASDPGGSATGRDPSDNGRGEHVLMPFGTSVLCAKPCFQEANAHWVYLRVQSSAITLWRPASSLQKELSFHKSVEMLLAPFDRLLNLFESSLPVGARAEGH